MTAAKEAGLKVFRTWGFNDKNVTSDYVNGMPQYGGEGAGDTEVVFQRWDNGKSTINLEPFDKVVAAASNVGIKLIIALTNNWADYGGMDVYTANLGYQYHDDVSCPLSDNEFIDTPLGKQTEESRYRSELTNLQHSSTANPRSRTHSSATSKSSSRVTRTHPLFSPGSSAMSPVAAPMVLETSRAAMTAPPRR